MSQLDQDTTRDATLGGRLRPEEDPWSALAVEQDDALGDAGIPSPEVGGGVTEFDEDNDDADIEDADAENARNDAHGVPIARAAEEVSGDPSDASDPSVLNDEVGAGSPEMSSEPEPEPELDGAVMTMVDPAVAPTRGGGFTIPMVCAGVAIIACCLLIPQADANRRLAYQQLKLRADLEAVERQVAVNDEFLRKVSDDPNLAERLAARQMKIIRPGTRVLELKDSGDAEMSPFQITAVAPPPKLPPYESRGGTLAQLCYNPKSRLYLMGLGLLLTAAGLVLGFGARSDD